MDLRGLTPMLSALRQGAPGAPPARAPTAGAAPAAGAANAAGGALRPGPAAAVDATQATFKTALTDALKSVSQSQEDAGALQQRYAAGSPDVSLEQTMVAMQKSQVAFQAAVTVRNRLVSAYTDIMNMNV